MISENIPSQKSFYLSQKFKFNLLSLLNILSSSNYLIINKYQNYLKSPMQEGSLVLCTSDKKLRNQFKFDIYSKIRKVVEKALFRFSPVYLNKSM